jgi:hypothetical protein
MDTDFPVENRWLRRQLLMGAPAFLIGAEVARRAWLGGTSLRIDDLEGLATRATAWTALAILQIVGTVLVALGWVVIVRQQPGLAARLVRLSMPFYVMGTVVFLSVAGVAAGIVTGAATNLPEADGRAVTGVVGDYLIDPFIGGGVAGVVATLGVIGLVVGGGALAAFLFGAKTTGPGILVLVFVATQVVLHQFVIVGLVALLIGMTWLELREPTVTRSPSPVDVGR